jgi:hypothetical protein
MPSAPKLARHGEIVKPAYAPSGASKTSWAGQSTDAERPDGRFAGIIKRYQKHEVGADVPISFGLIKARYSDSIEYTGIPKGIRGLIMTAGLITVSMPLAACIMFITDILREGIHRPFDAFIFLILIFFLGVGAYLALRSIRLDLFRPEDEPIIFDRKHRKVYRIFRETYPGAAGILKHWPMRAAEYDWDLIDVEHNATLTTTGSTIMRYHTLIFIVRKSATDPTVIDSFNVGNGMQLGEQTVPAVWEHIRRFMEEQGPHLPPGEKVVLPPSQSFLQSVISTPFWPQYRRWWKEQDGLMILGHLLFPVFLPAFLLWVLFNWLNYKTASSIEWPQEVLDAIKS